MRQPCPVCHRRRSCPVCPSSCPRVGCHEIDVECCCIAPLAVESPSIAHSHSASLSTTSTSHVEVSSQTADLVADMKSAVHAHSKAHPHPQALFSRSDAVAEWPVWPPEDLRLHGLWDLSQRVREAMFCSEWPIALAGNTLANDQAIWQHCADQLQLHAVLRGALHHRTQVAHVCSSDAGAACSANSTAQGGARPLTLQRRRQGNVQPFLESSCPLLRWPPSVCAVGKEPRPRTFVSSSLACGLLRPAMFTASSCLVRSHQPSFPAKLHAAMPARRQFCLGEFLIGFTTEASWPCSQINISASPSNKVTRVPLPPNWKQRKCGPENLTAQNDAQRNARTSKIHSNLLAPPDGACTLFQCHCHGFAPSLSLHYI